VGYLCFSNIEFYDSLKGHNLTNAYYPNGPWVHFPMGSESGFSWINCVIHDVDSCFGNGFYSVRGCIFWYVGWNTYEHVCYPSPASFAGNISAWHLQNVVNGTTANFLCESNIIFGGGQTEAAIPNANSDFNGGGYNESIDHNCFYNRLTTTLTSTAFTMSGSSPGNMDIFSNTIVAPIPVYVVSGGFGALEFTNNVVYASSSNYTAPVVYWNTSNEFTLDYNAYYAVPNGTAPEFFYDGTYHLTLSAWQSATGYDTHSTAGSDGQEPPNFTQVMVNADVPKRANIAIYNWSKANNVAVGMSGVLSSGDTYKLYSAQNYNGGNVSGAVPIATGTYNGTSISVPMTNLVTAPILYGANTSSDGAAIAQPAPTSPEFGAFVIQGVASAGTPNPLYISNNGSGNDSGADASDCASINAFVNTPGNWGSGVGQIPNGTHLIGVGQVGGGIGIYGNNITMSFTPGSGWSSVVANPSLYLYSGISGFFLDGTGSSGLVVTGNGSTLANQLAINGILMSGANNVTVSNLLISGIYKHTLATDSSISADSSFGIYGNGSGGNNLVIGCTFSNVPTAIFIDGAANFLRITNCTFQNCNHDIFAGSTTTSSMDIDGCFFGSASNWDTGLTDTYHNDSIIWYGVGTLTHFYLWGNTFNGDMGVDNTAYFFGDGGVATISVAANNLFIVHSGNYLNNGSMVYGGVIFNNTFINNGPAQVSLNTGGGSWIMNNLFIGGGTFINYAAGLSGIIRSNNVYVNPATWGNYPWDINGTTYTVSQFAAYTNAAGEGGSQYFESVNVNTVVNTTTGALPPGSPAIGAGNTNTWNLGVTNDLSGNARAPNGPVDVGAFDAFVPGLNYGLTFTNR